MRIADQAGSTEDQKAADVDISLFRDAAEALPASGRVLLWCQTEKGSKMARRFELGRIGHRGDNCRGGHTADPRDGGETPAGLVCAVPGSARPFDLLGSVFHSAKMIRH